MDSLITEDIEDSENTVDELELLKERADRMGVKYHPSIGLARMKEKIADALETSTPKKETKIKRNMRLRKEATELVRVRITCMNPMKKNWPGEVISISNSAIGVVKEFVPFNAPDGWHLPKVLCNILKEREFPQFQVETINGRKVKRTRMAKEFAIEVLDPLTVEELKDLAARQALNHSIE